MRCDSTWLSPGVSGWCCGTNQCRAWALCLCCTLCTLCTLTGDAAALAFVRLWFTPAVSRAYAALTAGVARADLWRYCAVYVHGGVYLDADDALRRPLDELLRPGDSAVLSQETPMATAWGTHGYSLGHAWLQLGARMVTAWDTEGRSLGHKVAARVRAE